ncbi:MAG: radical SAM protein [Victivallaceae bacterium]|nr:radical SAM protein [Victivallaceae bacterium]
MRLVESFESIQGESTYAGRPCFFLRLAGCNLACSYCDTKYAQSFAAGREISVDDAVALAAASRIPLVEVTGGEPLATAETPELCEKLLALGREVLIETNGACDLTLLPPAVVRIVDVKLPSSGMFERNLWDNLGILNARDEVKFVVGTFEDYECAVRIIDRYALSRKTKNILFSPVWGKIDLQELAHRIVADALPARLQLQMHKMIWPPEQRGV